MIPNVSYSTVRGIKLEIPRPAEGEAIVRVRRDTRVTLSFDIQSLLGRSSIYDGLKIPITPSVKNHDSDVGKKLLHLKIRVLCAVTKAPYDTLCDSCKTRMGNRSDGLPLLDFHARDNILVPQKNGGSNKILVPFIIACDSKHRKPNDLEYR